MDRATLSAPIAAALLAACASSGAGAGPGKPTGSVDLALRNVAVVDVESARVAPARTVLVLGGRIVGVVDAEDRTPAERVIDGAGAFLVPGLVDAHVHLRHAKEGALLAYLHAGITAARDMNGRPQVLRWRDEIAAGTRVGPALVVASPTLGNLSSPEEGLPTPKTRAEGAAYVDRFLDEGYDLVKVYTFLPREAFHGIVERARARGAKVAGHAPLEVPLPELLASGLHSLEHLTGVGEAIATPASAALDEKDHRAVFHAVEIDPAKLGEAAALAARHGVWQVPTIGYWEVAAPPPSLREAHARPELRALGLETRLAILGAMHAAGARIAAGTDSDAGEDVPVEAYWEELEWMRRAGMPAAAVLRAATVDALELLGLEERGRIREGLVADLVLLRCDPLGDVRCVRDPIAVVSAGQVALDRR